MLTAGTICSNRYSVSKDVIDCMLKQEQSTSSSSNAKKQKGDLVSAFRDSLQASSEPAQQVSQRLQHSIRYILW